MSAAANDTNTRLLYALDHTVNGNGNEGLKTKVARLEEAQKGLSADVQGLREDIKYWARWIIGIVVAGMAGIILAMISFQFSDYREWRKEHDTRSFSWRDAGAGGVPEHTRLDRLP